jgi:Mrp family chromosome partitioning ATPase
MKRFLAAVEGAFDHVIFDSPPILAVTDGVLLASITDGTILCVRAGRTPREKIARARDELLRGRVAVLGVLLNSLRDETRIGTAAPAYGRPEDAAEPAAESTARPVQAAG